MVGPASTKRRRTQSDDSSSSVGNSKKLRKSKQQSASSASKGKKRERPGTNGEDEATVKSPASRRKQPSRSASRGPSPAVSPRPPRPPRSNSSPRRPTSSPSVSSPHPAVSRSRNGPPSTSLQNHLVTADGEAAAAALDSRIAVQIQPSAASAPLDDDSLLQSSPKQSLPLLQSSPSLAESSPLRLHNVVYPERLTTTPPRDAVDIDPSCSARIAEISDRPNRSFDKRSLQKDDSHNKEVAIWWAKNIALILVLSLAFLSLVIVSWNLHLKDQERSLMDFSLNSFYDNDHVKLLLIQLEMGNEEMDTLVREQQKIVDCVNAQRRQLTEYIEQLAALEGEINKKVPSSKEERLKAGGKVARQFLKEMVALEEEVRADLQMVTDELVVKSGEVYFKELEVINETLLQPASDDVDALTRRLKDVEGVASTNKERLLRLGGTLEGLYEALEEKGILQNMNSWLTRAHDAQRIASKLQTEHAHSIVSNVIAEMTSWALNAIAEDKANDSSKGKCTAPSSKKDMERRIAELIDSSLGGGVGDEGGGADMASRRLGGSILHHPSYTSPEYATPTNLTPPVQWVLQKLRIPGRAVVKPPEVAISESTRLGDCWAFAGDRGRLTIELAIPIIVSSVSLEHVPVGSSMNKGSSAPKHFSVDGWVGNPLEPSVEPLRLIEGVQYNISSMQTQTFLVKDQRILNEKHVQYVTLNVESNHGNPDYTCIYQFHVHGSQKCGDSTSSAPPNHPSLL